MEIWTIPVEGRFILYRPLRRMALLGNAAMAALARALAEGDGDPAPGQSPATEFLAGIGFLEPDPPPPAPPVAAPPADVVLLLTSRCNLRCVYCYANGGEEAVENLSLDVARAAIDHVYQNAVDAGRPQFELTFHGGGEPVVAWDTLRGAVAHARAKAMPCHVSVVSNGVWTERQRSWILDNVNSLTISLDGRQQTQDRQRPRPSGRGSFQAVIKTVAALDRRGSNYGIRLTALSPWGEQLARDVEFICRETGCRSMQVEPAFNTGRGAYSTPTPEQAAAFEDGYLAALDIAAQNGRRLTFSGVRPWLLTSTFCTAPYTALIVTAAGTIVSCYEISGSHHPLTPMCTIGRIDGGRVVMDERRHAALLDRLAERRAGCRDCFCYWHCAGDCHAKALYPTATPENRCAMNRRITAQMLLRYISTAEDGVWRADRANGRCRAEAS